MRVHDTVHQLFVDFKKAYDSVKRKVMYNILIELWVPVKLVRWVDNIKLDFREIGWDGTDWINRAHDRDQWRALVNMVMELRVP
jgi:hypothetical protein